jgi:uncharacterized protein YjbI with pentapeptide repeats
MGIVIATLIVLTVIASVLAQDYSIFSWDYWQEGGTSTSRSEVVRNLGLLAAGVIGLGFGIWRAYTAYRQTQASQRQADAANDQAAAANEQARIAEQGHITDRFSTAVEHLGSSQLPVRLGGIYALWRLIEDSPKRDVTSVIDILCAFVRDPPHLSTNRLEPITPKGETASEDKDATTNKLRPDVQAILDLITGQDAPYRRLLPVDYRLNLLGSNLANADLRRADLSHAKLRGTNLTDANLENANLFSTDLANANLTRADLDWSNLQRVSLVRANLKQASLAETDLTQARLTYADLVDTYLGGANITGANLWAADLTDAILTGGNLTGAELSSADLTRVELGDADITGTNLSSARNLTQEQLDDIRYDPGNPPKLPQGMELPQPTPEPEAPRAASPPKVP